MTMAQKPTRVRMQPEIWLQNGQVNAGTIWSALKHQAIMPALIRVSDQLHQHGRACAISETLCRKPFLVLHWRGIGELTGHKLGLQFTYGRHGRAALDLSAIRICGRELQQASFCQNMFTVYQTGVITIVADLVLTGIEKFRQYEAQGAPTASWRKTADLPELWH